MVLTAGMDEVGTPFVGTLVWLVPLG